MRSLLFSTLLLSLAQTLSAAEPPEPTATVKLWPKGAPEQPGVKIEPEKLMPPKKENDVARLTNVTEPTIAVYRPPNANGAAVIVCPGGGYAILAIEHEGTQVCQFLNTLGVTAVLLKYRVPVRLGDIGREPLQDAQRAIGILHHRAAEWGIDPKRIGILGFSAGGHLTVMAALHPNERTYTPDPEFDVDDATPAFAVPIYPAYLVSKEDNYHLVPNVKVTAQSPPMCLIHADDDKGVTSPAGSALLFIEYKKVGVPAELHIFAQGGHGFGMRRSGLPVAEWPQRVGDWLKASGWLDQKKQ